MAVKLLGYGRLLRTVASTHSFDYSVAQATATWIIESTEGHSMDFLPLHDSAQGLKDAVSLSSGLGITEIWSSLCVQRSLCPSSTELKHLDSLARDIDSSSDVHGESVSRPHSVSYAEVVYLTSDTHANLSSDGIAYHGCFTHRR